MTKSQQSIVIYEISKNNNLKVPLDNNTVWLSQKQMVTLFKTTKQNISLHINNIFVEKELSKSSVVKDYLTTAQDGKEYKTKHYNLDVVISVGYRVKSLRGTQFRIWATKTLRKHILDGYTVNESRLLTTGINELEHAVNLVRKTMDINLLKSAEAKGILQVIADYTHSWVLLHKYDEGHLNLAAKTTPTYELTYTLALSAIKDLHHTLVRGKTSSKFFGMERDDHGLERILGTINQTYDGQELYGSVEEKAAHLLYFVIKDHPLIDGNKRSGALLFLHYLAQNGRLFKDSGERRLNDNALVALALLIAASTPSDKDLLIKLVTQLLANG